MDIFFSIVAWIEFITDDPIIAASMMSE